MIIATLFTTANNWKQRRCPPARLYKARSMHRMEHHLGKEECICDTARMDLKTLSDSVHTQKRTCSVMLSPRTGRTHLCWQESEGGCWEDCERERTAWKMRKLHGPWFVSCFGSVGSYTGRILTEHWPCKFSKLCSQGLELQAKDSGSVLNTYFPDSPHLWWKKLPTLCSTEFCC